MDSSGQKAKRELASSAIEQQPDLDAVFSTFFEKVEQLPSVAKPRSAKEYLQSNRSKIIHALSKGYTYEDLAILLKDCGFSISASTLRRYIGAVKGRKGDATEPVADADIEAATDSSGLLTQLSKEADTTLEDYQPKLKPRRK